MSLHLRGRMPFPGTASFLALAPCSPSSHLTQNPGCPPQGSPLSPGGLPGRAGQELPGLSLQPPFLGVRGRTGGEGRVGLRHTGLWVQVGRNPPVGVGLSSHTPSCPSHNPDSCHSWGCQSSTFRIVRQSRTEAPSRVRPACLAPRVGLN